jgi:hypothetical protein
VGNTKHREWAIRAIGSVLAIATLTAPAAFAQNAVTSSPESMKEHASVRDEALRQFYSGRYDLAIEATSSADHTAGLWVYDVRTSAIHFQLRRAMGDGEDRERLYKQCGSCDALVAAFMREFTDGRAAARTRLAAHPTDQEALFFLGRIDLNYVWLKLGSLGQRTGWNEYWEARRSLDAVLKADPTHARARIARAWIDYIVDTRMTRGFRWILGGGNRKRALATIRELAGATTIDKWDRVEAAFALWEIEQREKNMPAAVAAAHQLTREFPDNQDLLKFLAKNPG